MHFLTLVMYFFTWVMYFLTGVMYFFTLLMYFLTPQVEAQAANGWSVQEMFAKNEQFGVKTSYDPNMAGYTVQLNREKMDSNEYRSAFPTVPDPVPVPL